MTTLLVLILVCHVIATPAILVGVLFIGPRLLALVDSIHTENARMRQLYADTAKTSAEAAATWAEVRRKMLRGESRGEGN